jgi:hypothetical protein
VGPPRGHSWSSGGCELIVWGAFLFWMNYECKVKYLVEIFYLSLSTGTGSELLVVHFVFDFLCYSWAELYVKWVYLNLFGWRGAQHLWNILKGGASYKSLGTSALREEHRLRNFLNNVKSFIIYTLCQILLGISNCGGWDVQYSQHGWGNERCI